MKGEREGEMEGEESSLSLLLVTLYQGEKQLLYCRRHSGVAPVGDGLGRKRTESWRQGWGCGGLVC